jgi:hypothetical protein
LKEKLNWRTKQISTALPKSISGSNFARRLHQKTASITPLQREDEAQAALQIHCKKIKIRYVAKKIVP